MTKDSILKEIQSVDTSSLCDGLSFTDVFEQNRHLTQIERLLFYCNCKKYYYNYSEKRLRVLEVNLESIMNADDVDSNIFVCKDLEDSTEIEISALEFAHKTICFEDYHKVVTYDENTQNYECFFIALSKKKIDEFFKTAADHLPLELRDLMMPQDESKESEGTPENVVEALKTVCTYLYENQSDLSEIRMIVKEGGVKVDMISSRFFLGDDNLTSLMS